jgi:eukaryotic-like serine/threonine-protein kinase
MFPMKTCPTCQTSYPDSYQVCPKDSAPLASWGAWKDGTVVRGKYQVLGPLGQGGMADVYKALHVTFGEVRALKVMNADFLRDELFVKRFKQEAVLCRKLQHPNAVQVDDIDEAEDGRPFIVMEYVEGRSLRDLIESEAPMPVARVCRIARQVASALDAAHRLGMVHRDIKPANILVLSKPEGEQAKVLDFGIAKLRESRASDSTGGMTLTGPGIVVGTPPYMSPEQALGKRGGEIDGRSDLYSLGIVMYQMLTGELPFGADTTVAVLLAHIQAQPPPLLGRHGLKIPEPIAGVVMQCLEKKPEARPASAKALIEDLERAEKAAEASNPATGTVEIGDKPLTEPTGGEGAAEHAPTVATHAASEIAFSVPAAAPVELQTTEPPRLEPSSAATSSAAAAAIVVAPVRSNPEAESAAVQRKRFFGLGLTLLVAVILAGGLAGSWYAYGRYHARRILPSVKPTTPAPPVTSAPSFNPPTTGPETTPVPATTTAPADGTMGSTALASPSPGPPPTTPSTSVSNGGDADKKPAVVPTKTTHVSAHLHKTSTPAIKTIQALEVGTRPAATAAVPPVSAAFASTKSAGAPKPAGNPSLHVRSAPAGADVYLDDQWVGKTAPDGTLVLAHVAPGSHSVRMVHAGYQDDKENIILPPGASTETSAELTPVGASYHVSHDHFRGSTPGVLTVRGGRIKFAADKGNDSFNIEYADVKDVGQDGSGFYFKAHGKKYSFKSDSPAVVLETIRQATGLGSGHGSS